jgi:hypothetical protein
MRADEEAHCPVDYPAAEKAQAQAVASALGLPASALRSSSTAAGRTVVIGSDWISGTDLGSALPKAGALPTGAVTRNAAVTAVRSAGVGSGCGGWVGVRSAVVG